MPQNIPLAVALMVVSSLLIAIAATVQHHEVGQQGGSGAKTELSGDQFRSLIRSPRWWLGLAANGAGAVVAIGALMLAPVTITTACGPAIRKQAARAKLCGSCRVSHSALGAVRPAM